MLNRFLRKRDAVAAVRRPRVAALVEPLEGRRLLAADSGVTGPAWYGAEAGESAGLVESAARAPRSAAAEAVVQPTVRYSRPAHGAVEVSRNMFIAADVTIPNVGHGVDPKSLSPSTVKLLRSSDNAQVAARLNTSGGGDSIVLTPLTLLEASTQYTFVVTSGVKDTSGASFVAYSSTFTTGVSTGSSLDPKVQFAKAEQPAATGHKFTGLTIGPDQRMYAGTLDGNIVRFDIGPDGTLSAPLVIGTVNSNNGGPGTRTITGVEFDPASTATDLVLWVSHGVHAEENAPNWTGKVSRLSGASLETYKDYVTGLPRSVRDHLTNQLDFGPDGALYFSQASNTSMGAADSAWGMRPESLLTGAILRVDVKAIGTAVNVKTQDGGTYNPFAPGAPVTIYATGVRNAYDLVWHSNGSLYAPGNGGAAGGNTPGYDGSRPAPTRTDEAANGPYDGTLVPALANVAETQADYLYRVRQGGYYGQPNETRGEYVLNGGNPTAGVDPGEVASYPVGTLPDRNYRGFALQFGKSFSPDGIIEYRGDAFDGLLKGRLLVTRYSGGDDIAFLEVAANGTIVRADTGIPGLTAFSDPLDIIEDRRNGNLYVVEHGASAITLAKPILDGGPGDPQTPPQITTQPANQVVPEGQPASFSVAATGNGLRYQWQRNGVDIPGATSGSYSLAAATPEDGGSVFRVVVTNNAGTATSAPATLTVAVSRPPIATITTPGEGATYAAGESFTFAGTAVDPDEGELSGGAYTWEVTFHKGNEVRQFVAPFSGDTGGSFTIPVDNETSADVFYRIKLTVRDSGGLVGEATRDVTPRTVELTLAASVAGVELTLDGQPVGSNLTFPSVVGVVRSLAAPEAYFLNGVEYAFRGWSDGVATPARTLATPATAATLTANYTPKVGEPPPPPPPGDSDLTIADAAVARAGAGGRATVRVSNGGLLPFNAPATLELFLSLDAEHDAGDTPVATVARTLKLKAGASKPLKVKFPQPQVPQDGNYFLVARVVHTTPAGPAGDVGASFSTVAFPKPVIDFTGLMASPTTTVVSRGGKVAATMTLLNAGSVPASGPLAMTLFAVPQGDDPATGPRTDLATLTQTVNVKPNVGKRVKLSFVIPLTLTPGNYTLGVQLDPNDAFNESNESNNTVVALAAVTVF